MIVPSAPTAAPLRIAVVGSGVSGLSAAWLLSQRHEVTLFEATDRLGGHANTALAEVGGRPVAVDTGFIVYNEPTYPNLTALFDHLGVATDKSDMSFGVSLDHGAFEYSSNSPASYFRDPRTLLNPRFWSVLREVLRFYRTGPEAMRRLADQGLSLGEFLDACGYGRAFQEDHLLPQAAAIWSCTVHEIRDYPAASFVAFCDSHGLMRFHDRPSWRTVRGGSQAYVGALAKAFGGKVRTGSPVASIVRSPGKVRLTGPGLDDTFDHVVIAAHGDQALSMLAEPTPAEQSLLGAFRYTRNTAVLHTDKGLMPVRKTWWSAWNYLGHTGQDHHATVTYWMNRLQKLDTPQDVFVTLNPPPGKALKGEITREDYDHPVFDGPAVRAQAQLWSLQGGRNTWFCGAWFGAGFHEDGLQSGLAVAEALGGVRRPWTVPAESGRIIIDPPSERAAA